MNQLRFLLPLLVCGLVSGCDSDKWKGFFYPEGSFSNAKYVGEFASLEACRDAVTAMPGFNRSSDYECGLNCNGSTGLSLICEKTER
jgi:hypothetical protein